MFDRRTGFALALVAAFAPTALTIAAAQAPEPRAPASQHLALVGGMLLDGNEAPPIHHAAVLVEGNKILQVGPASTIKIPADATVIDTSGLTMMPGMIEAHAHLAILGHGDYGRWFPWLAEHRAQFPPERILEISATQLLMSGVTAAIDLGGPMKESLSIRERIRRGEVPGPRMQVSGPPISHRDAPPPANAGPNVSLL